MAAATPTLTTDGLVGAANQASGMAPIGGGEGGVSAQMMLKMIFGDVAQNPLAALTSLDAGNTALSVIFMYINIGLLTLGSIYLTYKTLAAVTQTAHDGDFIGKAFHTVWVPIRVTTGILTLVPIAGGWNALQVIMLWIGVMGAGLGNLGWQAVVNGWLGEGGKMQRTNVAATIRFGNGNMVASKTFEALLCDEAYIRTSGGSPNSTSALVFNGGGRDCGEIKIADTNQVAGAAVSSNSLALSARAVAKSAAEDMVREMRIVAQNAITDVETNLRAAQDPNAPLDTPLPDFRKYLAQVRQIGTVYQIKLNEGVYRVLNSAAKADGTSGIVEKAAKDYGFVSAGSFYTAYANSSYSIKSVEDASGVTDVRVNASGHTNSLYTATMNYYSAAQNKTAVSSASVNESDSEQGAFALLKDHMGFGGDRLVSSFIRHDLDTPALVNIKNTADDVVMFAGVGVTAVGAIMGMKDSLLGKLADNATGGVIGGAMTPWLEMAKFVMQMSLGFFLMCAIYMPLVPYIVFMGQVMEWLSSVMLGVASAPFLAFAHFDTDGEGLGQRTTYGYSFMLQSFMRPIMLILGFIFASAMIEVSIYFLTATYSFAVHDAQVHSVTGLFSIFGYIALYMVLAVGLVNTSCSLIYLLPDAIFEFMGAKAVGLGFANNTSHDAMNKALAGAGVSRTIGGMPSGGGGGKSKSIAGGVQGTGTSGGGVEGTRPPK